MSHNYIAENIFKILRSNKNFCLVCSWKNTIPNENCYIYDFVKDKKIKNIHPSTYRILSRIPHDKRIEGVEEFYMLLKEEAYFLKSIPAPNIKKQVINYSENFKIK